MKNKLYKKNNFILLLSFFVGFIACKKTEDTDAIDGTNNSSGNYYAQGGGVTDLDGNNYNTIIIGNQEWMAENLRTENFPIITNNDQFGNSTSGAMCYYDNDPSTVNNGYGALYNGYAARRSICPSGWHLPSNLEINELISYVDLAATIYNIQENIRSENSAYLFRTSGGEWINEVTISTNETGFSALPSGYRAYNQTSSNNFRDRGTFTAFWSRDGGHSQYAFSMFTYNHNSTKPGEIATTLWPAGEGFPCRCLKD